MNRKKLLFIIIISIFIMPLFVCAKEKKEVVLKSVQLVDQSTNVTEVDSIELEDGKIKTNLIFQDIGDNITYQIKVKNNSDIHYAIDGVIDNNENPSIHYDYTYSDADFDHGAERQIFVTITYQEEIPFDSVLEDSSYHLNDSLTIQLQLYDVNAIDINDIINPATNSTALIVYIFLLFAIVYFFVIKKKKKILFLFLLLTISTISFPVQAKQIIPFKISFQNQLEIPIHFFRNDWNTLVSGYSKLSIIKINEIPNDAIDISEKQDGTVKAWISDDTLYFGSPYRMYTPIESGALFIKGSRFTEINIEDGAISSLFTKNLGNMFAGLTDIQELNTSWIRTDNATTISGMFSGCNSLKKLDLSGFVNPDTTGIFALVGGCNSLEELDVSHWDNHKIQGSFSFAGFNLSSLNVLNVDYFDISSFTNISGMFSAAGGQIESLDLSTWDFSNIVSMSGMFSYSTFKNIIFGDMDGSKLEDISYIFSGMSNLESVDLSGLDTSNVVNMSSMFASTPKLQSINWRDIDTSSVTNVSELFFESGISSIDLSDLDFSSVMWATDIFLSDSIQEIILPGTNPTTSLDISLPNIFKDENNHEYTTINNNVPAKTKLVLDRYYHKFLSGKEFNKKIKILAGNSSVTYNSTDSNITAIQKSTTAPNISSMTEDNVVSPGSEDPIYAWYDSGTIYYYSSNDNIYLNENASNMFRGLYQLTSVDFDSINMSRTSIMDYMFTSAGYNASTFSLDLSSWDTSNVMSMSSMFQSAGYSVSTFSLDLSSWDTSNVTSMSSMFDFSGYKAATWSVIGLNGWDTSNVYDMNYMFNSAGYNALLWTIDVSNWDTSSVTDMRSMFNSAGYKATTWNIGDLSNWDTSKVTNMSYMFYCAGYNASSFDLDLSNWDTSNVTNMSFMFREAGWRATTFNIDLSNWDTSQVTNMCAMFYQSGENATTWSIGDLSNWNTSKVTDMSYMFRSAGVRATTWGIGDLSNWDTSQVTTMTTMFNLAGYYATTWNSIGTLKVYASRINNIFYYCSKAKATLKIYNNPTSYTNAFSYAVTASGSLITVDYKSTVTDIDNIIATKSSSSNVVKGSVFTS
ncbi:MAG: BspA family leucine-rich repeat surface protein [Bacilli bacterium]|nr:BspA family leucine-rich repeat surface protein [Bacilli bacterium]